MSPIFDLRSAFTEAVIIAVVLGLLFAQRSFRATLAAAPRQLRIAGMLGMSVWLVSQLAEIPLATYPLMSWHMYGESRRDAPVVGYRLLGETCRGEARIIPAAGRELGRRPVLAFGLERAFNDAHRADATPSLRAAALARADSLLALVVDTWNTQQPANPLCGAALQQVHIEARDIGHAPLPPYRTVRRYARGR